MTETEALARLTAAGAAGVVETRIADALAADSANREAIAGYMASDGYRDPADCPVCGDIHGRFDPWWACPDHAHMIAYADEQTDEWQDHFVCPEPGCKFGRWVG